MLYETDYSAWAESQAKALAEGRYQDLDLVNLADEVKGLSGSDKRAIKSHMAQLIGHLLKMQHQSERRGHSWLYTVREQRLVIEALLEDSPSLKPYLASVLDRAHQLGRLQAARDSGLPESTFGDTSYAFEQLLDPNYYPDTPAVRVETDEAVLSPRALEIFGADGIAELIEGAQAYARELTQKENET